MSTDPLSGDLTAHRDLVRSMLRPGGALASAGPHTTVAQSAWFVDGQPTAARRRLHRDLLAEHRERFPEARAERRAVVLATQGEGVPIDINLGDAPGPSTYVYT